MVKVKAKVNIYIISTGFLLLILLDTKQHTSILLVRQDIMSRESKKSQEKSRFSKPNWSSWRTPSSKTDWWRVTTNSVASRKRTKSSWYVTRATHTQTLQILTKKGGLRGNENNIGAHHRQDWQARAYHIQGLRSNCACPERLHHVPRWPNPEDRWRYPSFVSIRTGRQDWGVASGCRSPGSGEDEERGGLSDACLQMHSKSRHED